MACLRSRCMIDPHPKQHLIRAFPSPSGGCETMASVVKLLRRSSPIQPTSSGRRDTPHHSADSARSADSISLFGSDKQPPRKTACGSTPTEHHDIHESNEEFCVAFTTLMGPTRMQLERYCWRGQLLSQKSTGKCRQHPMTLAILIVPGCNFIA